MITNLHGYFTATLEATRRTRVKLADCPPGLFECAGCIAVKTDYGDYYIAENGDAYWGGTSTVEARGQLKVLPLKTIFSQPRVVATAPKEIA